MLINHMQTDTDKQLNIWFSPWGYTHNSWVKDSIFANSSEHELQSGYIPWCRHIGIAYEFSHYHHEWLNKYWIENNILLRAINLLGSMLYKQKDGLSSTNELRWMQQTALARPIILTKSVKFTSNFEAGTNLLYQVLQCYCPNIWTRFLLQLPKHDVQNVHIYTEPLLNGKMILIIEKLWDMILKKITT